MTYRNIVSLMRVSRPERDMGWLREALANAVQLELATLPPYLCAYWSIRADSTAKDLIYGISMQEMKHMGLAANMLVGVGGTPEINTAIPRYPGPLPGGVRPELIVHLAGLTKDYVEKICMQIEMPEKPLAKAVFGAEEFPTIGAFYDAIISAFDDLKPTPMSLINQVSSSGIGVTKINNYKEAIRAIDLIKLEGEGTTESPDESADVPAHYYKFGSILHEKTIVKKDGKWVWEGADVPFPTEVWPMAPVPAGGWTSQEGTPPEVKVLLGTFNAVFKQTLDGLQGAWTGQGTLGDAIGFMRALEEPAVKLMRKPVRGKGPLNYGPDFRV